MTTQSIDYGSDQHISDLVKAVRQTLPIMRKGSKGSKTEVSWRRENRGHWATTYDGKRVSPYDKTATCFCLEGLIARHLPKTSQTDDMGEMTVYICQPLLYPFKSDTPLKHLYDVNDREDHNGYLFSDIDIIDGLEQWLLENQHKEIED